VLEHKVYSSQEIVLSNEKGFYEKIVNIIKVLNLVFQVGSSIVSSVWARLVIKSMRAFYSMDYRSNIDPDYPTIEAVNPRPPLVSLCEYHI
jgi:hypothetical protein